MTITIESLIEKISSIKELAKDASVPLDKKELTYSQISEIISICQYIETDYQIEKRLRLEDNTYTNTNLPNRG